MTHCLSNQIDPSRAVNHIWHKNDCTKHFCIHVLWVQAEIFIFVFVTCEGMRKLDLENGEVLEGVNKFCYLGDVLSGEGGSNSASIGRVRCGWKKFKKFRDLSGILTSKKVALRLKGKVYGACIRSAMIYGSETWAVDTEQELRLERAEMRMVRWMCRVSLRERKTNVELREKLGIEKIGDVMRRSRLRWMGHVLRKKEDDWVRKSMKMEVH